VAAFAKRERLSVSSLNTWKDRFEAEGLSGLEPRPNPRNASGRHRGPYTPEERRQAVEAFELSGMTHEDFAKTWGVSKNTLSTWHSRYQDGGPKALEGRVRSPEGRCRSGKSSRKWSGRRSSWRNGGSPGSDSGRSGTSSSASGDCA
jgi:transposase